MDINVLINKAELAKKIRNIMGESADISNVLNFITEKIESEVYNAKDIENRPDMIIREAISSTLPRNNGESVGLVSYNGKTYKGDGNRFLELSEANSGNNSGNEYIVKDLQDTLQGVVTNINKNMTEQLDKKINKDILENDPDKLDDSDIVVWSVLKNKLNDKLEKNLIKSAKPVKISADDVPSLQLMDSEIHNTYSKKTAGNSVVIKYPEGGSYSNDDQNNQNKTGAMKITLPFGYTSTMFRATIKLYTYMSHAASNITLSVAGYTDTDNDGQWVNHHAFLLKEPDVGSVIEKYDLTVRFGDDGQKCCIWLGDITSGWSLAKAEITEVEVGYDGVKDLDWTKNWKMEMVTSLGNIKQTITKTNLLKNLRPLNMFTLTDEIVFTPTTSGWYTIAEVISSRHHAEFYIYDINSGYHNFIKCDINRSYQNHSISVTSSVRHAYDVIQHIRVVRQADTAGGQTVDYNRKYGKSKIQIYINNPLANGNGINVRIKQSKHNWLLDNNDNGHYWGGYDFVTPVKEDNPTGFEEVCRAHRVAEGYPSYSKEAIILNGDIVFGNEENRKVIHAVPHSCEFHNVYGNDLNNCIRAGIYHVEHTLVPNNRPPNSVNGILTNKVIDWSQNYVTQDYTDWNGRSWTRASYYKGSGDRNDPINRKYTPWTRNNQSNVIWSTTGVLDWNDKSNCKNGIGETLLLGTHANGPGPNAYYYPLNYEYGQSSGDGDITQFAIPYQNNQQGSNVYYRTRYGGVWSTWKRQLSNGDIDGFDSNGLHSHCNNANDVTRNSIYNTPDTCVGIPIAHWGFLHTMCHVNGNGWRVQMWYDMFEPGKVYKRYRHLNNGWSNWTKILDYNDHYCDFNTTNGQYVTPNGMRFKFGNVMMPAGGGGRINFKEAFPAVCVTANIIQTVDGNGYVERLTAIDRSGITVGKDVWHAVGTNNPHFWFAFGW